MHDLGVRGVRVNLQTTGQRPNRAQLRKLLAEHANKIRPYGWVLQLYIPLDQIALVAEDFPALGVPVVLDHLGAPLETAPPYKQAGYNELMRLLEERKVYVKLSGTYRFPKMPDLEDYVREILRVGPTQVVWASDWPHSGGVEANPGGDRTKIQDYRKVDIPGFVADCKRWCGGDEKLIRKIWVENPRRLWQYDAQD